MAFAHWARLIAQKAVLTAMPDAECSAFGRKVT
jgi:hypothetical protein